MNCSALQPVLLLVYSNFFSAVYPTGKCFCIAFLPSINVHKRSFDFIYAFEWPQFVLYFFGLELHFAAVI